jgi:hypothetical protein
MESAMRIASFVLAAVLATMLAGCAYHEYGTNYAYAPPGYYYSTGYSYQDYSRERYHNDWP